jgi:hypothetical protein
MLKTQASALTPQDSLRRALRLAVVVMGVGLVMATGAARAQDDDDEDDKTFEEKIIGNIMAGIGGTNMESRGIEYRERSPLVVPPKLDLPPPESLKGEIKDPNWPKDPDEKRRKAAIAARKKAPTPKSLAEAARPLTPDELNVGRTAAPVRTNNDPLQPGDKPNPMLSPAQLGYTGGLLGMFKSNKPEAVPFTGEPTRETLTQPPAGYQTPSPNYAYGTGPNDQKPIGTHIDVMTGKEVPN